MGDSSDSEEFYDAEEFTPVRGSKRSSLCKNISVTDGKEKDSCEPVKPVDTSTVPINNTEIQHIEDDKATFKDVVQGRRRFQELRRCMQTEEEEEGLPDPSGSVDNQSYAMEQPFKIIAQDTMSLKSMTSLGRIGRILSGASESHPNIRDSIPVASASSREPSTLSDDPIAADSRSQNVLAMAEPDVIASTKANSLRATRGAAAVVATSALGPPVPPPRRKRRRRDGDDASVCTTDTDGDGAALPSPATTIESLTRHFQDQLNLHAKYDAEGGSRSGARTRHSQAHHSSLDIEHNKEVSCAEEEWRTRSASRTHSEGRAEGAEGAGGGAGVAGRRRSAGDEAHLGLSVRTRTTSGNRLTDMQILEQVTVLNLDTGERVPLSVAEHKLPQCINPLSLHIMRLTSEYIARANDDDLASQEEKPLTWRKRLSVTLSGSTRKPSLIEHAPSSYSLDNRETDEESESVCVGELEDETKEMKRESADRQTTSIRRKTEKLKRFLGSTVKRTVDAAKSLAQEVSHARHKEDVADIADDVRGEHSIKLKASTSHKGPYDFDGCVRHVQEMHPAEGAVWCCRFSVCGRLLATAGQDRLLRVWVTRDAHRLFHDMRTKYNAQRKASPTPSQESLASLGPHAPSADDAPHPAAPFCAAPFCVYAGHSSDLLDVSWSKNYFVLSSSMDKTVRLWHISRGECLCCFQHIDFVTAIVFHPRDDRYFLSGSLDGKLRLWNIPDKKVAVWNEVDGKTNLITAANFCQNGKFAVVGTYDGRCIFYTTDALKYHTQIEVRSSRGKNSIGRKISGIEPMPNDDKILVTSNDSRIRLYDLRDLNLSCKYKGYVNVSSQIKASFSHDGKYIVSGSENQCIYIWKTYHDYSKFTSVRRDRNDFWEGIKAHNAVVTCAVFAPNPDHTIRMIAEREEEARLANKQDEVEEPKAPEGSGLVSSSQTGHVLVSADFNGCIKVFVHKAKPKHSSLPASAMA